MNILEKMLAIQSELETVAKNLSVGTGGSSYKAVSEADVLRAIKPLEEKYKVYSYAYDRELVSNETLTWMEDTWDYKSKSLVMKQKTKRVLTIKTFYRFVNVENPDEVIDTVTFGDGVDSGDKAPGKAITYSDKYAQLKGYKMVTGDDPDQTHSNDLPKKPVPSTETQVKSIMALIGDDLDRGQKILSHYGVSTYKGLNMEQASQCLKQLKK